MTRQMISIIFILAILSVFSCDESNIPFYIGPVIEIDPNHQTCEVDSDCVNVPIQCSCHCGAAVNEEYQQSYLDKKKKACALYELYGKLCSMACVEVPACIENQCVKIPVPEDAKVTP